MLVIRSFDRWNCKPFGQSTHGDLDKVLARKLLSSANACLDLLLLGVPAVVAFTPLLLLGVPAVITFTPLLLLGVPTVVTFTPLLDVCTLRPFLGVTLRGVRLFAFAFIRDLKRTCWVWSGTGMFIRYSGATWSLPHIISLRKYSAHISVPRQACAACTASTSSAASRRAPLLRWYKAKKLRVLQLTRCECLGKGSTSQRHGHTVYIYTPSYLCLSCIVRC